MAQSSTTILAFIALTTPVVAIYMLAKRRTGIGFFLLSIFFFLAVAWTITFTNENLVAELKANKGVPLPQNAGNATLETLLTWGTRAGIALFVIAIVLGAKHLFMERRDRVDFNRAARMGSTVGFSDGFDKGNADISPVGSSSSSSLFGKFREKRSRSNADYARW